MMLKNKYLLRAFEGDILKDRLLLLDDDIFQIKDENITHYKISFDYSYENFSLLCILSPILFCIFDNSSGEYVFLRNLWNNHRYDFGIFPEIFPFDYDYYKKNRDENDDIYVDDKINFTINKITKKDLFSLLILIDILILDKSMNYKLNSYFSKMRNQTIINGRRSILKNDLYAFYLSKYICVWIKEIFKIIRLLYPNEYKYLKYLNDLNEELSHLKNAVN